MTKEELAARITGREYPFDLTKEERVDAKASGLLVIYGSSDDLMEFDGLIHDEIGATNGTTAYVHGKDILQPHHDCDCEYCEYNALKKQCAQVKATWHPKDLDCSWLITTSIPSAIFDIMEDGELFCRGIVIDVKDLPEVVKP